MIATRRISVLLFSEAGRSPEGLREFKEGAHTLRSRQASRSCRSLSWDARPVPMSSVRIRSVSPRAHRRSNRDRRLQIPDRVQ